MKRSLIFLKGLGFFLMGSCAHTPRNMAHAPQPDPSQPVIRGTWALPVATEVAGQPQIQVTRTDDEMRVSLPVENFENPGFDRFGYWDQSGVYEHAYGGDRSGSFSYRFVGAEDPAKGLEIKVRLSAESQSEGKAGETSDVTLLINGINVGRQTVMPDNGRGRFHVWRVADPVQLKKLRIAPDGTNELRFVVDQKAKKKNGLCIYGKALDAAAPEPGEPITIVYRLLAKGGSQ